MAAKGKSSAQKRSKRRGAGQSRSRASSKRSSRSVAVWLWLILVLSLVATIWWMRDWRDQGPETEPPSTAQPMGTGQSADPAKPEAGSPEDLLPAADSAGATAQAAQSAPGPLDQPDPPLRVPASAQRGDGVRLAIVIDDLGRSTADAQRLFRLSPNISFAVLPFESKTREVVSVLESVGAETLLHLPMQASGPQNPGPGALTLEMDVAAIAAATEDALRQVGDVVGINNHMGSAFTEDRARMQPVIDVSAERGLFFLDSRTSAASVGFSLAREAGVPAAERTVFLDNDVDPAAIEAQFDRLLVEALRSGSAIAIGHPYPSTMRVLEKRLPEAIERGFELVRVSELLERSSSLY